MMKKFCLMALKRYGHSKYFSSLTMTIIYLLGLLAVCYLLFAQAGFLAFWLIIKWPLVIIAFLLALYDIDFFWYAIALALLASFDEKLPDWFWELMNLLVYLALLAVIGYFLIDNGIIK